MLKIKNWILHRKKLKKPSFTEVARKREYQQGKPKENNDTRATKTTITS